MVEGALDDGLEYNVASHWVSAVVERARTHVGSAFIAATMTLGWIPVALSVVAIEPAEASTPFIVAHSLVVLFTIPGPFYVWYYDERLLPRFFENVAQIVEPPDDETVAAVAETYDEYFSRYWWLVVAPWTLLGLLAFRLGNDFFVAQGVDDPAATIAYVGIVLYVGLFTGLGMFAGGFMIATIRNVSKRFRIVVEPLHSDGSGGIGLIGEFVIRTTMILSTGSLAIPLLLQVASSGGARPLIFGGIAAYTILIGASFLYPILRVNREARTTQEEMLDETRVQIRRVEDEIEQLQAAEEVADELRDAYRELERLERKYQRYRGLQLYPVSINTMLRVGSSVLLPTLFVLFESYLSTQMA